MRKSIHIDMVCFYAAVEIRDNSSLRGKPIDVGAPTSKRGVLCTCNYEARQYGVHSDMPIFRAKQLRQQLGIVPVNMDKYRQESLKLHAILIPAVKEVNFSATRQ